MIDKSLQIVWNSAVGLVFLGVLAATMAAKSVLRKK